MRYFLQRAGTDGTVFRVLDGLCEQLYLIKTVHPFPTYRLQVEGNRGIEAKIVRVPFPSVRAYSVSCTDLNFRIMISGDQCTFHGVNWRIRGSITAKNFDITDAGGTVIAAAASLSRVSNAIELNIFKDRYTLPCICTAVCLNLAQTVDNLSVQPV